MNKKIKKQNTEDKKEKSGMFGVFEHPLKFEGIEEVLKRKVVKLGNSGHVTVPSKHIGKDATITIWETKEEEAKKNN